MKKNHKHFCIPCITFSIISILLLFKISCITNVYEIGLDMFIIIILAFILALIGICTDSTYIFKSTIRKKDDKK